MSYNRCPEYTNLFDLSVFENFLPDSISCAFIARIFTKPSICPDMFGVFKHFDFFDFNIQFHFNFDI